MTRRRKRSTPSPHLGPFEQRPGPTPAEIAAECAVIREGWSEAEMRKRAGKPSVDVWSVPEVKISETTLDQT